jgi:glycosyltransferase involved in cell wall biosynthesis
MGYSDFKTNEKPIIVYSGKYQESYGGLPQLSKILNSISFDCQILLTGKANKDLIYKYFSENPKIEYLGFLDEVSLDKVFKKADIFINYRPPEVEDNIMIFPSKINQYLSYGKPVISSFTPGLSPDYENVLFYPESEDINSYLELFDNILKFNILEKKVLYYKIKNWFDKYKTWDILTDNLCNWINDNFNE